MRTWREVRNFAWYRSVQQKKFVIYYACSFRV